MTPVSSAGKPATLAITTPATSAEEPAQRLPAADKSRQHNHHHQLENRGLKIFRNEMMQAFAMQFRSVNEQAGIDGYGGQATASQAAGEILSMAKLVLSGDSQSRAATLIQIRQSMSQAISISHESAAGAEDAEDIDAAAQSIDQGLVDMETEEGLVTTASLTTIDTVNRQRTSLRIRTQEGDFVKLELRRMDEMSATDFSIDDGENSLTYTEVQVSSKSKLMLKVKGDLNEAELAAIQDVFAQAEKIADDFFSGDIEAALGLAASLNFDSEQIAGVGLKLRAYQASSISQTIVETRLPAIIADQTTEPVPVVEQPVAPVADDADVAVASPAVSAEDMPAATTEPVLTVADQTPLVVGEANPAPFQMLVDFFAQLTEFLDQLIGPLEQELIPSLPGLSPKFGFTLPVKIDFLKAAFTELAPENIAKDPADTVNELIDVVRPPLD